MGAAKWLLVRQDGQERKLLKIEQGGTGSLVVLANAPTPKGMPLNQKYIIEEKVTVHISADAKVPVRNVHTTSVVEGVRYDMYANLPISAEEPFVYPIFSRIVGNLNHSEYNVKSRYKSRGIPIAAYSSQMDLMFLFCFVTDHSVNLPSFAGFRQTIARFNLFNLVFYHAFSFGRTPLVPVHRTFATMAPKIEGIPQQGQSIQIRPMPIGYVPRACQFEAKHLIQKLIKGAKKFHHPRGQSIPYQDTDQWDFQPTPHGGGDGDIEYGIHAPLIMHDDVRIFIKSLGRKFSYASVTDVGTPEDMADMVDAYCWAGMYSQDEVIAAAGGDLVAYLKRAAQTGEY